MMPLAAFAVASCLAVQPGSDQILAGDLASALPGVTMPDLSASIAIAPAPGVQRVFHAVELRRIAAHFGWTGEFDSDICIERPVSPPEPARFLAAMRQALPEAEIAILDYGRQPVPAGEIEFRANTLRPGPSGALWTGTVRYAGTRRFAIWARVQILVPVTRVVAAVDLEPGSAIAAEQVRIEKQAGFPAAAPMLGSLEEAVGKWPRVLIHAGTPLRAVMIEEPKVVIRGDTVKVDVFNGAAHLQMEAKAEASGAVGETVPVLNPDSHRRFPARVEGKGRVSVGSSAEKVNP